MEDRKMSTEKKENTILWAPWRVKYITHPDGNECIFCVKSGENDDEKNFVLYRGEHAFALLNIYPYNNGHVMVAPYQHTGDLSELPQETVYEMQDIVKMFVEKLKEQMNPQGFNIGMNIGRTAGAGFKDHLHTHVVPRWNGDTNFMPVIGKEDVLSEALESAYRKLKISLEKS
jgi:ATP adenylyltransferase